MVKQKGDIAVSFLFIFAFVKQQIFITHILWTQLQKQGDT